MKRISSVFLFLVLLLAACIQPVGAAPAATDPVGCTIAEGTSCSYAIGVDQYIKVSALKDTKAIVAEYVSKNTYANDTIGLVLRPDLGGSTEIVSPDGNTRITIKRVASFTPSYEVTFRFSTVKTPEELCGEKAARNFSAVAPYVLPSGKTLAVVGAIGNGTIELRSAALIGSGALLESHKWPQPGMSVNFSTSPAPAVFNCGLYFAVKP